MDNLIKFKGEYYEKVDKSRLKFIKINAELDILKAKIDLYKQVLKNRNFEDDLKVIKEINTKFIKLCEIEKEDGQNTQNN